MNQSRLIGYAVVVGVTVLSLSAGCGESDTSTLGTGSGSAGTGTAGTAGAGTGGAGGAGTGGSTGAEATSSAGTGTEATSSSGTGGPIGGIKAGDLVFTEIMNNPTTVSDDSGEWFELHNTTAQPIDLAGLVLESEAVVHPIATSVKIAPNGYAVLGINATAASNGGVPVDYQYTQIKLQNTKGNLKIRTAGMLVIDATAYDDASGLDPDGQSRSLDPKFLTASMNDTDTHWCASTSYVSGTMGERGTPGKPNDACP